jgi:hypothetical protein
MIFTFCTTQRFERVLCLFIIIIIIIISELLACQQKQQVRPGMVSHHITPPVSTLPFPFPPLSSHRGSVRPNILNRALILSPIGVTTHSSYVIPSGALSPS